MSLLLLINPKNYGDGNADVFKRKVKAYKKKEQDEEEALAAKLLRERLQESLLPQDVEPAKLASELVQQVQENPATALSPARLKRVKMILILMIADII
jgi:hypothetical protein